MAYTSDGTIVLTPQRAILDASQSTVKLILLAPGVDMVGKVIAAIAVDLTFAAQIQFASPTNTLEIHPFTQVGQAVWFYGATESRWLKLSDQNSVPLGTYGDGSDGFLGLGSSTTYTTNKFATLMSLGTSVVVTAKNLIIFVNDTLTMNANSYFTASGSGPSGSGAGGSGPPAAWYGQSGGIGDGGAGGFNAGAGLPGVGSSHGLGGSGGDGGAGDGAGGSKGTIVAPTFSPRFVEALLHGQDRNGLGYDGGGGGGGGGAGDTVQAAGGGSGGGILVIVARRLVLNTSGGALFRSTGGDGGLSKTTNSGGGGGGGGGLVCLVYQSAIDQFRNNLSETDLKALMDVSGGSGGGGAGTGSAGSAGESGNKIVFRHG